ncbi:MAG: hypothetical protein VST69_09410 [Nitrospirota bacterium]|nr:hypothetical protein [Nitrospirota bacterium]
MTTIKISGDVIADIFPCNDNMPLPDFKTSDDPYGTAYAEDKTEEFAQSLIKLGLDPLVMVRALFMAAALKAVRYVSLMIFLPALLTTT